jgi:glycosyltransferase involved in cell wall biosynthesis
MRIYWYWPFAREEDIQLARSTPGPDDTLTVHALDRPGAPRESTAQVSIRSVLPDVDPTRDGSIHWVRSRVGTYIERARLRRAEVASGAYDVCHVAFLNQYTDVVDLRLLARRARIVTTVHDVVPHRTRLPDPLQHRLLDQLYRVCGTIVVHHEDVGSELAATFSVDPDRIHVVPHWVSPFRAPEDRRVRSPRPTVLFFGTLRRNKGIPVLLDAIAALADTDIDFRIAGRGDADLERAVRSNGSRRRARPSCSGPPT